MIGQKEIDIFFNYLKPLAKRDGLSFDFYALDNKENTISFEKQKLKKHSASDSKNFGLRLLTDKKSGVSYARDFSKPSIEECYNQALNSLKLSDKEERGSLSSSNDYLDMRKDIYNPHLSSENLLDKIEKIKNMDQSALSVSSKIQPIINSGADTESSFVFGNSEGLEGSYQSNLVTVFSYSLAVDGDKRSQGLSFSSSRSYSDIDFKNIGKESANKSLKKLDFVIPKTGLYPVIFQSGQSTSRLVGFLLNHLNGKTIHDKLSLLSMGVSQKKLSPLLSLYDEPTVSWGVGSAPFDGEGFPSQKTTLVEEGVIKNYLTNSFFAKALKVPHTANAFRSSEDGTVSVSPTNALMKEGEHSFKDLLEEYSQVVIIDSLKGLAGYHPISGDFSIESEGFLYSKGSFQPLCQFTVSGNLIDVFANISKVAKDSCVYEAQFKTPSFLIPELSIAGK